MLTVVCHHPSFIPWPGFFYKAAKADIVVLLDNVQFPLGISWVNRNRLKNKGGVFWLTVPVWKKGRGKQRISQVEVCNEKDWQRKHPLSLLHAYRHAPYFPEHAGFFMDVLGKTWKRLADLNESIIRYLLDVLGIRRKIILGSSLQIEAEGEGLLIEICKKVGAGRYMCLSTGKKYIHEELFRQHGIEVVSYTFTPPVYPQLWGDFIRNLSMVDLLFNCGAEKALAIMNRPVAGE